MRRALIALTLAFSPALASAASLSVPLDQSLRLTLTSAAHDVIVGNPGIADVSVADDHHLIVTGKQDGMTNLIVTDQRGRTIFDRQIVVHGGGAGDAVTLITGATATTYACAPTCETTTGAPSVYGLAAAPASPAAPAAPAPAPAAPASAPIAAPAPGNTSAIQASPGVP
ncbi:MAG TPA: pilus assembly protein N-terminal domain-containing protein [Caulobacteraceae bacterium]|nr:pilus assembly protein N-terminal domain-containing protein [Caulobacteraceae bacterium]